MARNTISQGNSRAGNLNSETVYSSAELRAFDMLELLGPGTPIFTKAKLFAKESNQLHRSRRYKQYSYFEPCARYEGVNVCPPLSAESRRAREVKESRLCRVPISLQSATSLPGNRVDWQLQPLPLSAVVAFFLLASAYLRIIRPGEASSRADFLSSLHTATIPRNYHFCPCYRR